MRIPDLDRDRDRDRMVVVGLVGRGRGREEVRGLRGVHRGGWEMI